MKKKIKELLYDTDLKTDEIDSLTKEILDLYLVMLSLPSDEEIDKIERFEEGNDSSQSKFAEMCMREGAKLLRDKLKRSEA